MRCRDPRVVKVADRLLAGLCALALGGAVQADITVTQLANAGVILSDGETRVMIDGMVVEPYAIYGGLPKTAVADLLDARGDFADIDIALVSHRHHEHNQPAFACDFLQASTSVVLYSSEQVIGLVREFCRRFVLSSPRVQTIDPQYGQPHVIEQEGVRVTVFPLSHGTRKYARIQHYGHLVEIGGLTVLHVGDAAMDPAEFERAGLADVRLDVALIPIRFFEPGPGTALIERYLNAPLKIAVHIAPGELEPVKAYMAESFPQVQILDTPLKQLRFAAVPRPADTP